MRRWYLPLILCVGCSPPEPVPERIHIDRELVEATVRELEKCGGGTIEFGPPNYIPIFLCADRDTLLERLMK